jgi:hypothetical protein
MTPQIDLSRAQWRKSTHSNNGGACVEAALNLPGVVAIRDSKNPDGPVLVTIPACWEAFTSKIKAGEFGLPADAGLAPLSGFTG